MTLVDELRALGLPMGSRYAPREQGVPEAPGETITVRSYVGWTTDAAKADAARDAGATLRPYRSAEPRFCGWEVVCHEVVGG